MRHLRSAFLAALALSLLAHGLGAYVLGTGEVEIEGGVGSSDIRLGNSFADFSHGTVQPESQEPIERAEVVEETETPEPVETAAAMPPREVVAPALPEAADSAPVAAVPAETPEPAEIAEAEAVKPEEPEAVEPEKPEEIAAPQPEPEPKIVEPEPEESERAEMPPRRPDDFEPLPDPEPDPEPVREPAPERGNAPTQSTAGRDAGEQQNSSVTSGASARSTAQGNAAASNYPGEVMARLMSARRPRIASRGTAVVGFSVASSGALATLGLIQSSGTSALDRAAIEIVRGAAPFPPPPPGAQRSFSVPITGQ